MTKYSSEAAPDANEGAGAPGNEPSAELIEAGVEVFLEHDPEPSLAELRIALRAVFHKWASLTRRPPDET